MVDWLTEGSTTETDKDTKIAYMYVAAGCWSKSNQKWTANKKTNHHYRFPVFKIHQIRMNLSVHKQTLQRRCVHNFSPFPLLQSSRHWQYRIERLHVIVHLLQQARIWSIFCFLQSGIPWIIEWYVPKYVNWWLWKLVKCTTYPKEALLDSCNYNYNGK